MTQVKDIITYLEQQAPLLLQESYDNSGLQLGSPHLPVERVLLTLDVTETLVEEARRRGCQLIIAHHPLIFKGLKSLTGKTDPERAILKALQYEIAIYAAHTNLDNIRRGVNARIGSMLGLPNFHILQKKSDLLYKLAVYVPHSHLDAVRKALFNAGAGRLGDYDECSFSLEGLGSFRPGAAAHPHVGATGRRHYEAETRLEVLCEKWLLPTLIYDMKAAHPYEEVAYDLYRLEQEHPEIGSGMIGDYPAPQHFDQWLAQVKSIFGGMIRYTRPPQAPLKRIAWCGGSGSFLLPAAKKAGAQVFLSSDFKYHQFYEADNEITIVDIGHFENEQFTPGLIADLLRENFSSFAVLLAETKTNPINYL